MKPTLAAFLVSQAVARFSYNMDTLKYLRIPYKHQGRDYKGADCFGLLRIFYLEELGIDLPDYEQDYLEDWWKEQSLLLDMYSAYGFKKVKYPEFGSVILFKNTTTNPGHIGIVIDDANFIHMTRDGVGVACFQYGVWARQIHSFYKLKKNAYKIRRPLQSVHQ